MITAEQILAALQLRPLPREGGYYRETYRSPLRLPASALGAPFTDARSAGTAIYYLLTPDTCSALHRLAADEVYHFYLGEPVEMLQLDETTDTGRVLTLGPDILNGQCVQVVAPAGVWQGSVLRSGGSFALLGTTVAPGFEFADYQPAECVRLKRLFPAFAAQIDRLCPDRGDLLVG